MPIKQTQPKARPSKTPPSEMGDMDMSNITEEERRRMVAEAAYFNAINRGFLKGTPEDDWYQAEAQINAMIAKAKYH